MSTTLGRFFDKVDITPGCWLWTAGLNRGGYGQFKLHGRARAAHRVAWELLNGDTAKGLCVVHKCGHHACVNPDHLLLKSHADNMADIQRKGREAYALKRSLGGVSITMEVAE